MQTQQQIAKHFEKLITQFETNLKSNPMPFPNKLGSCQYGTIEIAYNFILECLNKDRAFFEKLFKISYFKQNTLPEFLQILRNICLDAYNEDPENQKRPNIRSIADYYNWTKNNAWDLWSAAQSPLSEFQCQEEIYLPTAGPILNQMAQSENWSVALSLAYTSYIFKTDISVFSDFDT